MKSSLTSKMKDIEKESEDEEEDNRYQFNFDLFDNQEPYKVTLQIKPESDLETAILQAVDALNQKLVPKHLALVENIEYFVPRLPRKNGKPKTDMPCLDIGRRVCDLKVDIIAIQIKNKQKAIIHKQQASETEQIEIEQIQRQKTSSNIKTDFGDPRELKEMKQIPEDEEEVKKEKQSDCFCSFC